MSVESEDAATEWMESAYEKAKNITMGSEGNDTAGFRLIAAAILAVGIVALSQWFDHQDDKSDNGDAT